MGCLWVNMGCLWVFPMLPNFFLVGNGSEHKISKKNIRLAPKVRSALKSRSKSFAPGKVWLQATHEACKAANEVEALSLYPFSSKYTPLAGQPWQKDPVGHMVWHPRFLGQ